MKYIEETQTEASRYDAIDFLRGAMLIFVMWGHTYVAESYKLVCMLCTAQMPVFYFISGLFFPKGDFKHLLVKVFNRLIMPLAVYEILYRIVRIILAPEVTYIGLKMQVYRFVVEGELLNYPLWYVRSLIMVLLAYYGWRKLRFNRYIKVPLMMAFVACAWYVGIEI